MTRVRPRAMLAGVVLVVVLLLTRTATAGAQDPTTTLPPSTTTTKVITTTTTTPTTLPPTTTTTAPATTTSTSTPGPEETTTTAGASSTTTSVAPLTPPASISATKAAQLKELSGEYEDLTAEELDLVHRIAKQTDEANALADQVKLLNEQLATAQAELSRKQSDLDRASVRLLGTTRKLQETEEELEREQARLRDQAVEAYMGGGLGGGTSAAAAIMAAESPNRFGESKVYADALVDEQQRVIERVRELQMQADILRDDAEISRDSSASARDEIGQQAKLLEDARNQREQLKRQVDENNALQGLLLAEVSARRADRLQRMQLLAQTSDGISATLANRQVGQQLPANRVGIFLPPLADTKISSPYGGRIDPITGSVNMHAGVDMVAPTGTPIRAVADGLVVIAFEQGGYGNCTVIDHGNGLGTLYGHQTAFNVTTGDTVVKGQIIGFVGSTGRSTGPHLHWEVREFGQPVDPLTYLGSA